MGSVTSPPVFLVQGESCRALIDVDVSVGMLNSDRELVDYVQYNQEESKCRSVVYSGDSAVGGAKDFDEAISVALAAVPLDVHHILLEVSLYKDGQEFRQASHKDCLGQT